MDEAEIIQYIKNTFAGVESVEADGGTFFFYGSYRMMPFATLVTKDEFDQISDLNRPNMFRVNIGVSKATFVSLLGQPPPAPGSSGVIESEHDFTALDQIMPHPVYGNMFWVCALNPDEKTSETVRTLLKEGYERASGRGRAPEQE
jgi:Family of unknown function (DUF6194)